MDRFSKKRHSVWNSLTVVVEVEKKVRKKCWPLREGLTNSYSSLGPMVGDKRVLRERDGVSLTKEVFITSNVTSILNSWFGLTFPRYNYWHTFFVDIWIWQSSLGLGYPFVSMVSQCPRETLQKSKSTKKKNWTKRK